MGISWGAVTCWAEVAACLAATSAKLWQTMADYGKLRNSAVNQSESIAVQKGLFPCVTVDLAHYVDFKGK